MIELRTSEAIYLIKISAESREEIDQFLDQDEAGAAVADEDGADADDLETPDGADDEEEEKEEDMSVDDDDDGDKEEVGQDEDED
ncbi:MAG: hypothetical protein IPO90_12005 [Flavobacteriales bacterium]|nr:hypothetical protein [Flavobacteriales bacterium]